MRKKIILLFLSLLLATSLLIFYVNVAPSRTNNNIPFENKSIIFDNKHPAIYFWLDLKSEYRQKIVVLLHSHGFNISLTNNPPNETITENLDFKYAFVPSTWALTDENAMVLISKANGLHIEQDAIYKNIAPSLAGLFSVTDSSGSAGFYNIVSINFTSTKHDVLDGFSGKNFYGAMIQKYVRHSIRNLRDDVEVLASFKTDGDNYYPFLYAREINGRKYVFNGFSIEDFYSVMSTWNSEDSIQKYVVNVAMWLHGFSGATFSFWHKNNAKFGFTWRDDDINAGLNRVSKVPIFINSLENYKTLFNFFAKRDYRLTIAVVTEGRNGEYPLSSNPDLVNLLRNISENHGSLIASHTLKHSDLSEKSSDAAKMIINESYNDLLDVGLNPAKIIVLPGSGYNFVDHATGRAAKDVGMEAVEWIRRDISKPEQRWHNMEPYEYNDSLELWLSYGSLAPESAFTHQILPENWNTGLVPTPFNWHKNKVDQLYGSNIFVNYISHFILYNETKEINEVDKFLEYIEEKGSIWNPTTEELISYYEAKKGIRFVNGNLSLTKYSNGLTVRLAVPKPLTLSYDDNLFSNITIEEDSFTNYYYLTLKSKEKITFSLTSTGSAYESLTSFSELDANSVMDHKSFVPFILPKKLPKIPVN